MLINLNYYDGGFMNIFLFVVNLTLTFIIIFLERKSPQSTYAWLLFLWIIPILGFLFYLLFSQNFSKRKIYKYDIPENRQYQIRLQGLKYAKLEKHSRIKELNSLIKYRQTIHYYASACNALFTNNNTLEVYINGKDKFNALLNCINDATSSIHLEYYIIKYDTLGKSLLELLIKKASEGVEVRLLFDELGGRYIPQKTLNRLRRAGGFYGTFYPSRIFAFNFKINYRNHRKIAIIDGHTAFIGGYNIGVEYLGLDKKLGYWRDTHLKIKGYAAYELQMRFFLDWRTSSSANFDFTDTDSLKYFPEITDMDGVGIQIVSSGPDTKNQVIKQGFVRIITNAETYVYIQSPYFVPDESVMEALKIAVLSGVDVRIMIPNKPDHIFIYWATLSYVGELVECGAKIYIYEGGFLHSKTIVADDTICSVGSCNFDIRSFSLNFETNAFIYDSETSKKIRSSFLEDLTYCRLYSPESYQNRTNRLKIKESISRLFSPLL